MFFAWLPSVNVNLKNPHEVNLTENAGLLLLDHFGDVDE
jgi:hypothetical protein